MKRYELYDRELLLKRAMQYVSMEQNEANRNAIDKFLKHLVNTNISKLRIVKYAYFLVEFSSWLGKAFSDANKSDLEIIIDKINEENYAEKTKEDYKFMIKRFYKWLLGNEETYPEQVKWIKVRSRNSSSVLPENLLTLEEVSNLADSTENIMEKAFVMLLYESGARPEEFLTLRIMDVSFDSKGVIMMVKGKTGMRRIRLVSSHSSLLSWVEMHPYNQDIESPLWIDPSNGNRMSLRRAYRLLSLLASKAGIRKKLTLYLFRHSRATELADVLTEAQMCEFFGWQIGSKVARVYVHLSGRNLDYTLLATRNNQSQISIPCSHCLFLFNTCRDLGVQLGCPQNLIIDLLREDRALVRLQLLSSLLGLSIPN